MNCLQSRRLLLAAPRELTRAHRAHVDQCEACSTLARRVADLDRDLSEAAMVRPPDALADRILLVRGGHPLRQYAAAAMVAGLALGLALVGAQVLEIPGDTPAVTAVGPTHPAVVAIAEVVDEQPALAHAAPAPDGAERGLRELGLTLKPGEASAHYVGKCRIDGSRNCEHIVLATDDAHVNIMLVADYPVRERLLVADRHMVALVNPAGTGGYIVVADTAKTAKKMERLLVKG